MREAEDGLRSLRAGEVGRLVVGSFQSVSVNVLPEVVGRLRSERPGLSVRCEESDENEDLVARLMSDELDLTFLIGMPDHDAHRGVATADRPVRAGQPARRGVAGRRSGHVGGVADDRSVAVRVPAVHRPVAARLRRRARLRVPLQRQRRRAGNGAGRHGAAPCCRSSPSTPTTAGWWCRRSIRPSRHVSSRSARRRGRTLAPAADRFIEIAIEVCRGLQQPERQLVDGLVG